MGWASGSLLAEEIWDIVKRAVPKTKHKKIANKICEAFEGHDCDTLCEAESLYKAAGRYEEDEEYEDDDYI